MVKGSGVIKISKFNFSSRLRIFFVILFPQLLLILGVFYSNSSWTIDITDIGIFGIMNPIFLSIIDIFYFNRGHSVLLSLYFIFFRRMSIASFKIADKCYFVSSLIAFFIGIVLLIIARLT
jgi:hypothetical protein